MAKKHRIWMEIGIDEVLCAGCRGAEKIGIRYWYCRRFHQWLEADDGRPMQCQKCLDHRLKEADGREQETETADTGVRRLSHVRQLSAQPTVRRVGNLPEAHIPAPQTQGCPTVEHKLSRKLS